MEREEGVLPKVMQRHNIPARQMVLCYSLSPQIWKKDKFSGNIGSPWKPTSCAGKGVPILPNPWRNGKNGKKCWGTFWQTTTIITTNVVIEDFDGMFSLLDRGRTTARSKDYKTNGEGDKGLNTAVIKIFPVPLLCRQTKACRMESVWKNVSSGPTVEGLAGQ